MNTVHYAFREKAISFPENHYINISCNDKKVKKKKAFADVLEVF